MNKLIVFLTCISFVTCTPKYKNPHILIETSLGKIEVELFPDKAPKTVAAFLSYVDAGMYDRSSFYRVLKNEGAVESMNTGFIQGGIWRTNPFKMTSLKTIDHEPTSQTGLSNTDGTISMASTGAGTAKSEFFICIGDQSQLDAGKGGSADAKGYAAFGKVVDGMDVVRNIQMQPYSGDAFNKIIPITNIKKF